jgi:regulator of nucleoside diphosphate kinase
MPRNTTLTHTDYESLCELLDRIPPKDRQYFATFQRKLQQADLVDSTDIPPDIITMDSVIRLWSREPWTVTLVLPWQADIDQDRISVLSGVGTALIGARVGDAVDWPVAGNRIGTRIIAILYQPEAAGTLNEPVAATG